jgi:CSLREA domain-containing protein
MFNSKSIFSSPSLKSFCPALASVLLIVAGQSPQRAEAFSSNPSVAGVNLWTVTKIADTNDGVCNADCSLREAIAVASAGDNVTFSPLFNAPQTITLSLGDLGVNKNLSINGPGARLLTISGNNLARVFTITGGSEEVTMSGLTVANGNSGTSNGGGIFVGANNKLTLTSAVVRNNLGANGGGIAVGGGSLIVVNSLVSNNVADGEGSGGGGISSFGFLVVVNSTISGNNKLNVSGNGGGINIFAGTARIINSTITDNQAAGPTSAGGVYRTSGTVSLRNTIVAANRFNSTIPDVRSGTGAFVSDGNNLIGNIGSEAVFIQPGDQTGTDTAPLSPRLTPLQNFGGPTDVHLTLSNSTARNNGNNCVTNLTCTSNNPPSALTTDQRGSGFPRLFGNVDIGAYEANNCTYTLPTSILSTDHRADGVSFDILTSAGCAWNVFSTATWISVVSAPSGTGNGNISINIQANSTIGGRSGTLYVGDRTFQVLQSGLPIITTSGIAQNEGNSGTTNFNWTVSLSSTPVVTATVNYQATGLSATAGTDFIAVSGVLTFAPGETSKTLTVPVIGDTVVEPDEVVRVVFSNAVNAGILSTFTNATIINDDQLVTHRAPFDFDGDNKTDIGIFRPPDGTWWINRSSTNATTATQFGVSTDRMAPADFTGDGKTDIAVWRPSDGSWYILRSENFSFYAFPFGTVGDIPAPADYDDDGKADAAVFRPSTGTWYVLRSAGGTQIEQFGVTGDVPVSADYDNDGRADLAIFRPLNGQWWIKRSTLGVVAVTFGNSADKPTPGDFTGDGKADVAIWRPSDGNWFVLRSEDFSYFAFPFGTNGDLPAPGDYDGDGKADATVFRPSSAVWFINRSGGGTTILQFGATGDRPVASAFVP